jgi:hypothetical protein
MKRVDAGGLDWMGRSWDLRTWTRASDGAVFYPYVFSKTLPHDNATGLPLARDVDALLDAVQCPSAASIGSVALDARSARMLEGLTNCHVHSLMGGEQSSLAMPSHYIHAVDSAEQAFEMAEVYAMATLRDVPFVDYVTDEKVRDVLAELNKFARKTTAPTVGGRLTPRTLLRGGQPGTTVGPYVSQFFFNRFCARAARRCRRGHTARVIAAAMRVGSSHQPLARLRSHPSPPEPQQGMATCASSQRFTSSETRTTR